MGALHESCTHPSNYVIPLITFLSNDRVFSNLREYERADLEELEKEEEENRKIQVEKARLKSRLFHSDRALLHKEMPQAGIQWEKNDDHRSNNFKSAMLARYGKKTGIDPEFSALESCTSWYLQEYLFGIQKPP